MSGNNANTVKARDCKMLDRMIDLWALEKGLNPIVGSDMWALQGSSMQSWYVSGQSLLRPCRGVKARSAKQCEKCATDSM